MADLTQIRLLVLDVDGIMTDGTIRLDNRGVETKRFHVRDGLAIKLAQRHGIDVAILTARSSQAVALRMRELGVELFIQGMKDKAAGFEMLLEHTAIPREQIAYMGDDLQDWPVMRQVGFKITVADGSPEIRDAADLVTTRRGGQGAVREAVEHLLKAQGKWDKVLAGFGLGLRG
ncbi:MAG: KdsC family phosphatase [Phycisphaeraceae bacterium]